MWGLDSHVHAQGYGWGWGGLAGRRGWPLADAELPPQHGLCQQGWPWTQRVWCWQIRRNFFCFVPFIWDGPGCWYWNPLFKFALDPDNRRDVQWKRSLLLSRSCQLPQPLPTHLHAALRVWVRLAPPGDTSVPPIPRAQAQHQHCTENLPIPSHCIQKISTSIWQSYLGSAILRITTLPPPKGGLGEGKELGNSCQQEQWEHNLQFTHVLKVKMWGIKTLLTHRI